MNVYIRNIELFFNRKTIRHTYANLLYTEFFQCKTVLGFLFLEKFLNSKLLLFDFIHQMLFELLPNVKKCC